MGLLGVHGSVSADLYRLSEDQRDGPVVVSRFNCKGDSNALVGFPRTVAGYSFGLVGCTDAANSVPFWPRNLLRKYVLWL